MSGAAELMALGLERRCAIMCSEAIWWRCHRRLVADQIISAGQRVYHLADPARMEPTHLSAGASLVDGRLVYPARGD